MTAGCCGQMLTPSFLHDTQLLADADAKLFDPDPVTAQHLCPQCTLL
jgi:hypothetical protein